MSERPIYLDHNSTTPIDPRVLEAMNRAWRDDGANPASQHTFGRKARRVLEDAREGILALLGAKTGSMDADQLIFTSGGTEANNLALLGLSSISTAGSKPAPVPRDASAPRIIISAIEHPSLTSAANEFRRRGCEIQSAAVNAAGDVALEQFARLLESRAQLVSLMLANNETGVIQPVAELTSVRADLPTIVHTDAVQAVGKIPVHFRDLGVDAMTVAPHKFHGPLGIGALILRYGIKLQPQIFGGFQQAGLRPGTESVAHAVGFHHALELAVTELAARAAHMQSLRDELEQSLLAEFSDMVIIGASAPRLPNTSCVAFPGLNRQALVMALDLAGVACSTGSACASGSSEPSPTLLAMGLPRDIVEGSIRLSLGSPTTAVEATAASRRIINTVKHLRSQK